MPTESNASTTGSFGKLLGFALAAALAGLTTASAEPPTRAEVLSVAQGFAQYRWEASEKNVRHGKADGVEIHTPNRVVGDTQNQREGLWQIGAVNVGMPYKWGGFDTIESFMSGIRAGKAAGDIYSVEKRRQGGAAVSSQAVGIDCSGFISRCWKLDRKHATSTLPSICRPLRSSAELLPGDILNGPGGHVVLFARWLDEEHRRALFYEAEPFSKVIASEEDVASLEASGMRPLRYRAIRD